jgi:hypothetical protein
MAIIKVNIFFIHIEWAVVRTKQQLLEVALKFMWFEFSIILIPPGSFGQIAHRNLPFVHGEPTKELFSMLLVIEY